jgi:hypothetical protein
MPEAAAEARPKRVLPPGTNVARFNKPGREQPKATSADGSASIKPRLARHGYVKFLTLADLDARSRAAAFAKNLVAEFESDLGGADNLTAALRQLTQRGAVLSAIAQDFETRFLLGEAIELPDYLAAVNNLRRVLRTIGLERKARDVGPSLADLMRLDLVDQRQREAVEAAGEPAVELGDPEAPSAEAISEVSGGIEEHASDGAAT